ncbi:glycine receptor subunit alpha-3-like [Mercenaria mercenaria]|uniref:glycine receptor subunit alpha-3-like n=1 Tax=Mercenaria mercenaria TaxID=6596 RepID=UPI00234F1C9E|nr:glycine receptor subunit alpha-3-like [Mercenaria mercenaria]
MSWSTLLESIFDGYDKKLPPNSDKDGIEKQVQVTVNMYINSMFSISEMNMDYSMSVFLRERWIDDRLRYDDTLNITRLILDNTLFESVWMPDMYILNEKKSDYHEVMVSNKLIHIYPDGTIQHSARVTGTFSCLMHLQKYPFDTQYCKFEVESYGHSTEDLRFIWSENAVSMAKDIEFPQFSITEIKSNSCEKDYYGIIYPCIGVTIVLERNYAYYIIQIYVPCFLIVMLSWVSFWLDPTSVPARISLGLLTVLTMTTQSSGARANLPRVSYVKAIDVYMATCLTFVFLALLEFAFVNMLTRGDPERPKDERRDKEKKESKLTTIGSRKSIKVCPEVQSNDEAQSVLIVNYSGTKRQFSIFTKTMKTITGATVVYSSIMLLVLTATVNVCSSINVTMSTILDDIFTGYDKKLPPKFNTVGPDQQIAVVVNLFVNSMFSIREANMDYSMSIFLRERWVDERLKYTDVLNLSRLELDSSMFGDIWMPDLYIVNEKESDYHEVTIPNKMVHIYPDGTVQFSARVTGIFSCRMYLHKYPFDTQTCRLDVESYGHSTNNLKFEWDSKAVTVANDILLPNVFIKSINSYNCDKDYFGIVYPCIGVTFVFVRNFEYYILQIYLPSILIVILSWVSFWLDCTAVPARISLGLLTVLTMTTQSSTVTEHLPRVSYLKAIDVYMAACLTFVFLGLVEFAYVNVLTRVERRRFKSKPADQKENDQKELNGNAVKESLKLPAKNDDSESNNPRGFEIPCFQQLSNLGRARMVDKISRVMFPLTFVIFNIVYWCLYFSMG